METSLMVYDYPEQPEDDLKRYLFKCSALVEVEVYAKNREQAEKMCNLQDSEGCDVLEIVDILGVN